MGEFVKQLVHLRLAGAGFEPAHAALLAEAEGFASQLEAGETRLFYQVNQLRRQTMNKLGAQFHRQFPDRRWDGVDSASGPVSRLDQRHLQPGFR